MASLLVEFNVQINLLSCGRSGRTKVLCGFKERSDPNCRRMFVSDWILESVDNSHRRGKLITITHIIYQRTVLGIIQHTVLGQPTLQTPALVEMILGRQAQPDILQPTVGTVRAESAGASVVGVYPEIGIHVVAVCRLTLAPKISENWSLMGNW